MNTRFYKLFSTNEQNDQNARQRFFNMGNVCYLCIFRFWNWKNDRFRTSFHLFTKGIDKTRQSAVMKYLVVSFVSIFISLGLNAQELDKWEKYLSKQDSIAPMFQINDSTFHVSLPDIEVYPHRGNRKRARQYNRYSRRYQRLEQKVRKVYPYAKLAGEKLKQYNHVYLSFSSERERKKYAKSIEQEIKDEFEGDIRKMKISEGRILIKLIDREAGINSYQIIKEFRGGFQAFLWQTVASIFGHDLKSEYSPQEEDRMIEHIVKRIEREHS